jgi:hypothetical protein
MNVSLDMHEPEHASLAASACHAGEAWYAVSTDFMKRHLRSTEASQAGTALVNAAA